MGKIGLSGLARHYKSAFACQTQPDRPCVQDVITLRAAGF